MRQHFHPLDRSPRARYWRGHDRLQDRIQTFVEIQAGPNPLTADELVRLAEMAPERWGMFKKAFNVKGSRL